MIGAGGKSIASQFEDLCKRLIIGDDVNSAQTESTRAPSNSEDSYSYLADSGKYL